MCQVFENVNTGGVTLTVFELLTATFASDNFSLRDDWHIRYEGGNSLTGGGFLSATQLIPLAAIFVELGHKAHNHTLRQNLAPFLTEQTLASCQYGFLPGIPHS